MFGWVERSVDVELGLSAVVTTTLVSHHGWELALEKHEAMNGFVT